MGLSDDKKFLKAIGQKINKIRKEKKVSFQELSYITGIEKSNIVKLTTKGSNITMTTFNRIAQGLGVSAKELFP